MKTISDEAFEVSMAALEQMKINCAMTIQEMERLGADSNLLGLYKMAAERSEKVLAELRAVAAQGLH